MALILTFLGKGGVGCSVSAIAAAKQLAAQGQRVLLVTQETAPGFSLLIGTAVGPEPQPLDSNLWGVQLKSTVLLEQNWEMVKRLEAQYLRDPFFKAVYGQELSVLPGMDEALALNAIREYDGSGEYDVIVHDGSHDRTSLRMWAIPEGIDWYFRRFKKVFQESQIAQALSPFVQPVANVVLSGGFSGDLFDQPQVKESTGIVAQGKAAVKEVSRVRAYVVTTGDEVAIATGRYLWGAAQQIGLSVGGVLVNRCEAIAAVTDAFDPLPVSSLPPWSAGEWQPLMAALPDFQTVPDVPSAVTIDLETASVSLFLPSFDKKQIQLTQYGPEVTVEAGDQRHNLSLPPALQGRAVTGAKFQSGYLIISFA
ncbi:MAG: ArsA family ATPase [Leptolyngbya sp. SIO4C1]|nr:ArsA family ATPase [Leptolyngbya sp. SIO4C1]